MTLRNEKTLTAENAENAERDLGSLKQNSPPRSPRSRRFNSFLRAARRPCPGDLLVQARPHLDTVTDWPRRLSDEEAGGTGTPAASRSHRPAADAKGDKYCVPGTPCFAAGNRYNPDSSVYEPAARDARFSDEMRRMRHEDDLAEQGKDLGQYHEDPRCP